jgi:hypothetical protein
MTIAQQIGRSVADTNARASTVTFLNWALASALTGNSGVTARKDTAALFHSRWPRSVHKDVIERVIKAPVAVGDTTTWGTLVELKPLAEQFVEYLRPLTVLGRMSASMRTVPFNVRVPRVTGGASAYWIGQGKVKAASALALDTVELPFAKICALVVISRELAKLSDPAAEAVIRNDMANLFAAITTNFTAPFLVMRPATAIALAQLRTASGDRLFPNVGATGGDIWGVSVLTSVNVPADANSPSNYLIVLIDAAEVLLAEGSIEIRTAANASIQMETAPDSPATASTVLVDFFQRDLLGLMAERYVYWQPRRSGAVAYMAAPF